LLSGVYLLSISVTLLFVAVVSIYASKMVKNVQDFSVGGRKLGAALVGGSLVGAFVGGTSTVGTAQAAYLTGLNGIWFTLGAGLSCWFLALFLAKPLRNSQVETIPQLIESSFGGQAAIWSTFFISVGIIIQIAAQVLSAIPIVSLILNVSPLLAGTVVFSLIICCSIFGGVWSTGFVGIVKTLLLNTALLAGGFAAYTLARGYSGLLEGLGSGPWFSLFPHGISVELGAGISVIVGFISTQTYLQIIFSARSAKSAQLGAVIAGALIPLTGLASVMIGMFMRISYPDINPASALPLFILKHLNPWLGGVILATLILSLVMTGAALTLGAATIFTKNVYHKLRPRALDKELIWICRFFILLVVIAVMISVTSNANAMILQWAFLSMALRGATVFFPLLAVLFFKERVSQSTGKWAVILAPLTVIVWSVLGIKQIDPLYPGMIVSFIVLAFGFKLKKENKLGHSSDPSARL